MAQFASDDFFPQGAPLVVRVLWQARWKIGALLVETAPKPGSPPGRRHFGFGCHRTCGDAPWGPAFEPFTPLYLLEDEWAAEMANRTGTRSCTWVPDGSGGYRGQMAVLVKPNRLLGTPTWRRSSRCDI